MLLVRVADLDAVLPRRGPFRFPESARMGEQRTCAGETSTT
jgi:hypothetical protein